MKWKIPLFKMYWDEDDLDFIRQTITTGMNWAAGPQIAEFENTLAQYCGSHFCLSFNSGTSALHAALLAHGVGKGDEVIVPSFTFIATANSPQFVGAKPVFADIEENNFGLDPVDVERKITKKTKAIIPIHYGGCPCRIEELRKTADDYGLILIEDAAEAWGARIDSRYAGTFGDSGILSFCQNKIITTGEGGAVVTDNRDIYEKMKLIRSHGRLDTCDYFSTTEVMDYITLGYNFRMSTISASLGLSQLKKTELFIQMRRDAANLYRELIGKMCPEVRVPEVPNNYFHVYQLFTVLAKNRDGLTKYLENLGIMTKLYFPPVHKTHFYNKGLKYVCSLPVTEKVARDAISLPIYPGISKDEILYVVEAMASFYRG